MHYLLYLIDISERIRYVLGVFNNREDAETHYNSLYANDPNKKCYIECWDNDKRIEHYEEYYLVLNQ